MSAQDPAAPRPGQQGPALPSPAAALPAPVRNGTVAWALGFLAYIPVPFLGLIVAGVVQLVVGLGQRKHGGLAAVNGVRAANWGLTQLCWPVLMVITIVLGVATGSPGESGGVHLTPVMRGVTTTLFGLFFLVCVLEAIYAIVGTVLASKGRRVWLPVIPFLRTPRS
ncbi:hypothetical protein [Brachybacterium ginsengisoli]|uniref:hypothetical protein n=1 Tax=Brachybacterium ginsengisoli TaxID=1331682 RepID=UPI001D131458|nr:hypothetical protein [Brachybacterium ginsengisoli]